ncbi:MAG: zf-HC2 domain-containing protein [Acidobacteriota bacterium]
MERTTIKPKLIGARNLWILRHLPPCKEIVQIVSASLDGRLTLRERLIMRLHLMACRPCVRYMRQSEFLSEATHHLEDKLKEEVFTGHLTDESRQRIKEVLRTSAI